MPTVAPPKQQEPMEAVATIGQSTKTATGQQLVTKQPKSEPMPEYDSNPTLRGGGMHLGCSCCKGRCNFRL
ncbi:hypothetical protein B0H66DRAFT_559900 [Apodospora peruviana]|uniref:Uncharacterized protein n=1 Tax=Apodospora peruviana TaxID=516989 RepID=A0AAE0HZM4_9PEZI|nr:hypothetical protein B0H66DRAFT_559900 [Apodospora peruviana]